MQPFKNIIKVNRPYRPFISSYMDLDRGTSSFVIGNDKLREDDVFLPWQAIPTYIKVLCELVPTRDFNKSATITSKYEPLATKGDVRTMRYKLYNSEIVDLKPFVSSIDIKFIEFIPDCPIDDSWSDLLDDTTIYTKAFKTQNSSAKVAMKQDRRYEESEYNHLISEAIPFSGYYHAGVMLHEIEQYFCYIGTELQAKEYITVVSSRNLLRDNYQNIIPEISEFTSLEDDISTGKVGISVQGKDGQSIRYKSIFILKNTIMSDACVITFRRDADDETH